MSYKELMARLNRARYEVQHSAKVYDAITTLNGAGLIDDVAAENMNEHAYRIRVQGEQIIINLGIVLEQERKK